MDNNKNIDQLIEKAARVSDKINQIYAELQDFLFVGVSERSSVKAVTSVLGNGRPYDVKFYPISTDAEKIDLNAIAEAVLDALHFAHDKREKYIKEQLTKLQQDEEIVSELLPIY